MRHLLLLASLALLVGCPSEDGTDEPPTPTNEAMTVLNDAGDEAFVRRALPLLWGRAPASIHEVQVLVDLIGLSDRESVVRAMVTSPEFLDHWQANLYDWTSVARLGYRANIDCYAEPVLGSSSPDLAMFVRDQDALSTDFGSAWSMYDLTRSALALDDLSPFFEADLYAQLTFDAPVMNLAETAATRSNAASAFQRNYLNREMECLPCHNSESGVTDHNNPEFDRAWSAPGYFEQALFGESEGMPVGDLHIFFRRDGVTTGPMPAVPGESDPPAFDPDVTFPWGMSEVCGTFAVPDQVAPDRLEFEGYFGSAVGDRASMWDLEPVLRQGLDALRGGALEVGDDQLVSGPDAAAYMLAMSIAEKAWYEAHGLPLTLSFGIARNEAQRTILQSLADRWLEGSYSLADLLVGVLTHPYFVQNPPDALVGTGNPYYLDRVFQPFSDAEQDPAAQGNSTGDAIRRRPARVLLTSAYRALDWGDLPAFPDPFEPIGPDNNILAYGDEAWIQQGAGLSMKHSSSGFRTIDFQTLLAWESWLGTCTDGFSGDHEGDWVDRMLAEAQSSGASVADALSALKDRLLTDPVLDDEERGFLAPVLGGVSLDQGVDGSDAVEQAVRTVCGLWLTSPQFQLGGAAPPDRVGNSPALVVAGQSYQLLCEEVSDSSYGGGLGCSADTLSLP